MILSKRVLKKIATPFEDLKPNGAILMVNLIDPQISTLKVFVEAVEEQKIPYLLLGNKIDRVERKKFLEAKKILGGRLLPLSLLRGDGLAIVKREILKLFPKGTKIVVLGIFNSGKTSLIARLTGLDLKISDLPGTTLEFTRYPWDGRVLIDTVGQVIDINKPLMVSIDLSSCKTLEEKIQRILRQDAESILATLEVAVPSIKKVVKVLQGQIQKGKKVITVGAGASALVAQEMAGQGLETGIPILVFTNNLAEAQPISFSKGIGEEEGGLSRYLGFIVNPGDVVIGVSASGGTGFVYDALARARKKRAITVAITENIDSPLGRNADFIIKSNAKPEGPSSSKIQAAHLAIGHALILALADERGVSADQSIAFMLPESVATKKMGIK